MKTNYTPTKKGQTLYRLCATNKGKILEVFCVGSEFFCKWYKKKLEQQQKQTIVKLEIIKA